MKNLNASSSENAARSPANWQAISLAESEFREIAAWIGAETGVHLAPVKRSLVQGRLAKRLRQLGLPGFAEYLRLIHTDAAERQLAIDLLTTHETSFFRHPLHFEKLAELSRRPPDAEFLVWSAACSTGEEPYSIAMVLAENCPAAWRVFASDISAGTLARAARGEFRIQQKDQIAPHLLKRYCLRGVGEQAHLMKVVKSLRQRVRFVQASVLAPPPFADLCDVVFLRNVIIYFPDANKDRAIRIALSRLKTGGHLILGGSDSLRPQQYGLRMVQPAIYCKE